jgi:hemerythrin-like domain-containing protein
VEVVVMAKGSTTGHGKTTGRSRSTGNGSRRSGSGASHRGGQTRNASAREEEGREEEGEAISAEAMVGVDEGAGDCILMLEQQHRQVERTFEELMQLCEDGGEDVRPKLLELADLITSHAIIEERHFYPRVRAAQTEDLIADSYHDHDDVKNVVLHILDAGPEDDEFLAKVEELQGLIEAHVMEEEQQLFPQVRKMLSSEDLQSMTEQMLDTMRELDREEPRDVLIQDLSQREEQA